MNKRTFKFAIDIDSLVDYKKLDKNLRKASEGRVSATESTEPDSNIRVIFDGDAEGMYKALELVNSLISEFGKGADIVDVAMPSDWLNLQEIQDYYAWLGQEVDVDSLPEAPDFPKSFADLYCSIELSDVEEFNVWNVVDIAKHINSPLFTESDAVELEMYAYQTKRNTDARDKLLGYLNEQLAGFPNEQ